MDVQAIYEEKYSNFASLPYYSSEAEFYGQQFESFLNFTGEKDLNQKTLIDLGCGFGMKSHIMKKYFSRVKGVDFASNIIAVNNLLSNDPLLTFEVIDLSIPTISTEKFDFIVANGLSLFNSADLMACKSDLHRLIKSFGKSHGVFVIWSFTDFSSTAPSGWYNHSMKELNQWMLKLSADFGFTCQIHFPYKRFDFRSKSITKLLLSIYRYFRKRQYYFISIKYEL